MKKLILPKSILMLFFMTANAMAGDTGSITSGTATYTINSYESTAGISNDLIISDGVAGDLMFEHGWLYRVSGDDSENVFPVPDSVSFDSDFVIITWNDVDGRGLFSATLLIEIDQPVAQSAVLTNTLTLKNISAGNVSLDAFHYNDIDVNGSFANDIASLLSSPDYMAINDGLDYAEYRAGTPNNYKVTPHAVLRTDLTDGDIDNLNNTGLPMTAGDFTGAFQWTTDTIPVDGEYIMQTVSSFNTTAPPALSSIIFVDLIYANGFE